MALADGHYGLPTFFGTLAAMSDELKRFGQIVRERREELGIQQEDVDQHGGPSSTTMSRIERGEAAPAAKTLRKLDTGLDWEPGSAKRTLEGGNPTPLAPEALPQPRVVNGRNMHPGHMVTSVVLSPQERATLAGARQKLLSGGDQMTDEERTVLGAFLEEEELRTLHARVDWLPRQEQLLLSTYVNDLHLQVADRLQPLGVDEDEPLADRPHPLPYEGSLPGDPDFNEGDQRVLETASESSASPEAVQDEEAQLSGDAEREDVALTVDEVAPAVEDVGVDSQDGQAFGQ